MRRFPAGPVLGAGLVLVVLGHVTRWQHQQIEWAVSPAPVLWWFAGVAAALVGPPLFFVAAGSLLGDRAGPAAGGWYVLTVAAAGVLLWRLGPGYGLTPVRDLPELVRLVLLPPAGTAPAYGLAVFPVLARFTRRTATPVLLTTAVLAAALATVAATRSAESATTAALLHDLVFFLAGHRLLTSTAGPAESAASRALARIGSSAAPIAAVLVPFTAVTGVFLVERIGLLGESLQMLLALAGPVLLATAVIAGGLVPRPLPGRVPGRVPVPR